MPINRKHISLTSETAYSACSLSRSSLHVGMLGVTNETPITIAATAIISASPLWFLFAFLNQLFELVF
jgi:hypothetical protein